jgi:hypothetical protein
MGRPKIKQTDKKIKFGISLDPKLYQRIKDDGHKVSTLIEKLVREYYGNKNLW